IFIKRNPKNRVRIRINGFSTQLKKENCCIRAILPFSKMMKFYWKLIQIKKPPQILILRRLLIFLFKFKYLQSLMRKEDLLSDEFLKQFKTGEDLNGFLAQL